MLLHLPLAIAVYRVLREIDIYLFLASRLRKGFYIDLTYSFIYCMWDVLLILSVKSLSLQFTRLLLYQPFCNLSL